MPSWDLLDENCSSIADWDDLDAINGVSDVYPAGQFRFHTYTAASGNYARRSRDIGSFPDNFTYEIKVYHVALGTRTNVDNFFITCNQTARRLHCSFSTSGLEVNDTGSGWTNVGSDLIKTGSDQWQIWRFVVPFGEATADGTCDIYLKDDTHNWEKVGDSIPSSYETAGTDGITMLNQNGYITDNRVTRTDYVRALTGHYVVYPNFDQLVGTEGIAQSGIRIDRASNGDVRSQVLYSSDRWEFTVKHLLTSSQKTTLDDFYSTNKELEFTFPWDDDGEGYNCIFVDKPRYTLVGPSLYDTTVLLAQKDTTDST